jgi:hypothetical protein
MSLFNDEIKTKIQNLIKDMKSDQLNFNLDRKYVLLFSDH